jgi:aminoglycoside phosphotransferase (APT) family kinase protein
VTGKRSREAELDLVQAVQATGSALVHGDLGGTNLLWNASGHAPHLTGILDWDEAHIGNQAEDLASIAATFGWPLATRLDGQRHAGDTPTIRDARAIAATFALQQALPAALGGDTPALDDGLLRYREPR